MARSEKNGATLVSTTSMLGNVYLFYYYLVSSASFFKDFLRFQLSIAQQKAATILILLEKTSSSWMEYMKK